MNRPLFMFVQQNPGLFMTVYREAKLTERSPTPCWVSQLKGFEQTFLKFEALVNSPASCSRLTQWGTETRRRSVHSPQRPVSLFLLFQYVGQASLMARVGIRARTWARSPAKPAQHSTAQLASHGLKASCLLFLCVSIKRNHMISTLLCTCGGNARHCSCRLRRNRWTNQWERLSWNAAATSWSWEWRMAMTESSDVRSCFFFFF